MLSQRGLIKQCKTRKKESSEFYGWKSRLGSAHGSELLGQKEVITGLCPNVGMTASKGMHEYEVLGEVTPSGERRGLGFSYWFICLFDHEGHGFPLVPLLLPVLCGLENLEKSFEGL